jgi:hypothetical protein
MWDVDDTTFAESRGVAKCLFFSRGEQLLICISSSFHGRRTGNEERKSGPMQGCKWLF